MALASRQDHSYPLCADGTLQPRWSWKAEQQAWETFNLAQSQQEVSQSLNTNAILKRQKKQAEQQTKRPINAYKF